MAEYILLETMSNELDDLCDRVCVYSKKQRYAMCGACPLGDAFIVLENIQTVDAVPVVRCKDCCFWDKNTDPDDGWGWCRKSASTEKEREGNFFCAYGAR